MSNENQVVESVNVEDNTEPEPQPVNTNVEPITEVVPGLFGQVKWFNNTRAYGWITVVDGDYKGNDVFVHMKNIKCNGYKTLKAGEYVQFDLSPSIEQDKHPYHATDVTGPFGGPLMCDVLQQRKRDQLARRREAQSGERQDSGTGQRSNYQGRRNDDAGFRSTGRSGGRGRGNGRGRGRGGLPRNNTQKDLRTRSASSS